MSVVIQIRNVPEELHRTLKARAALEGKSLSDYLLEQVAQLAAKPSVVEWQARLATREPVDLREETLKILREDRDTR